MQRMSRYRSLDIGVTFLSNKKHYAQNAQCLQANVLLFLWIEFGKTQVIFPGAVNMQGFVFRSLADKV